MKRRLFSLFLALVMCLSLLPTAAFAEGDTDTTGTAGTTITGTTTTGGKDSATAAPTPVVQSLASPPMVTAAGHSHCLCGTTHIDGSVHGSSSTVEWQAWMSTGNPTPPTSGNYYLIEDITLNSTWEVSGSTVLNLCLNGHKITLDGDGAVIKVASGKTFNLTDCQGTGTITHSTGKTGSGVKVESGGTFNLYNGSITGNSGTLRTNNEDHTSDNCGGGVYIAPGGTFNMYGGTITGNSGTNISTIAITGNCGGGVYIAPTGTFNMYGGSITGNTATSGGGVYIEPIHEASGATFNMYGGSITNNEATSTDASYGGGGVFVGDCGAFNMSGGTISGNSATRGGGVCVNGGLLHTSVDNVTFNMSGGSITGNNATEEGGGVYGGAYHAISGNYPADTAKVGNTFQLSGNASVTDNTLGGTLNTTSKIYTGGTANNMFVPSWVYSIHVANGFTGSFGVTVDENDWTAKVSTTTNIHGTYWKVVRYEVTGSSTSGAGNITYDNERFTFHSKGTVNEGKLTCNHLCGTTGGGSNYKCSICGSNSVVAEVTRADNTKRCYENLPAAIENADNNGTVKLLKDVEINFIFGNYSLSPGAGNTVKLDLNGKDYKIAAGDPVTIANGTLEITDSTSSSSGSIDNLKVANGAKLIVSKNPTINSLTVETGGAAELKGGKYGQIKMNGGGTCLDLLPTGYAYFDGTDTGDALVNGNVTELLSGAISGVKKYYCVKSHTCTTATYTDGTCACGRECPHSSINNDDGKCTDCQAQMVVKVDIAPASGTAATKYFTTLKAAIAAIDSGDTFTITLLADHTVSDDTTEADLTISNNGTLDLNGKKLTIGSGKKLTVSAAVAIKGTGASEIAGVVVAGASANLTIEGNPTIGELTVTAASATVQLKGGTYGKIDASSASKTIASLLAPGYKFKSSTDDDSNIQYSTAEENNGYQGIKVEQCVNHAVTDADEYRCMFCDTAFAVDVYVSGTHYYCQTLSEAMAYIDNYDTEDTKQISITLRDNVTEQEDGSNKTITFNRRNPLSLFMNGKTLAADITVASGTTLTINSAMAGGTLNGTVTVESGGTVNIENGTFTKLDVKSGGNATLSGGTFGTIVVAGTDKDVGSLLKSGYSYRSTASGTAWEGSSSLGGTSLTNVSVQLIPLTGIQVGLAAGSGSTITYGDSSSTTILTATAIKPTGVTAEPTYSWSRQKVGGTTTSGVGSAATLTVKGSDLAAGTYDFSCTVTVDGYSRESNVRITVNKADLGDTIKPTAKTGLTFQTTNEATSVPKAQELVTAPTGLPEGCTVHYRLGEDGTWTTNAEDIKGIDAKTYTVQWYIDASGNDNYYDTGSETAPQSLTVTIAPMKVAKVVPTYSPDGINQLSIKHWDSQKNIWCDDGLLTYTYTGEPIEPTIRLETPFGYVIESGYSVEYRDNTIATTLTSKPTIIIKDTDLNDNFQIMDSEFPFTIDPKPVTLNPNTYTHYAEKPLDDYPITFDLKDIAEAMGMPTDDGDLKFLLASEPAPAGPAEDTDISMEITSENALKISGAVLTGDTPYTATIKVSSNNHKGSFTLNIVVSSKIVPHINHATYQIGKDYDGTPFTAAQAGAHFELMDPKDGQRITAGTWKWEGLEGSDTGPTNVADSGKYMLTFTPSNNTRYDPATKAVQVTINAKSLADSNITATADGGTYTGEPITPTLTVKYETADGSTLTLTEGTDYTVSGDTGATNAGTYSLTITGKGNYTGTRTVEWTIAPRPVSINSTGGGSKLYDGTTDFPPTAVSAAFTTGSSALSFAPGTHYNISNVRSAGADVGDHPVSATVTLVGDNYVFAAADNEQFYTSAGGKTATMYANCSIWPYPLETRPTVKESVIKLQQDVSVNNGSHPLFGNVNAALMDVSVITPNVLGTSRVTIPESVDIDLDGELRFALGTLPAKVSAQIDAAGMLSYSISGGKAGEKFAIPVTVTMPNLASYELVRYTQEQIDELVEYAMAQAERNGESVILEEILAQIGEGYVLPQSITLSFTVEVELTGDSRQVTDNDPFAPIHRQPIFTGGSTGSGSASGNGSGNGSGVASPNTGDAGIAVYGVMSLSAALGCCATGCTILSRKRRRG